MKGRNERMKVYIIERGYYSDKEICAVTLDKEKATILKNLYARYSYSDDVRILTYDTDVTDALTEGKWIFYVSVDEDGVIYSHAEDDKVRWIEDYDPAVRINGAGHYYTEVLAEDEERARKIALDRIAEYKYKEAVEEI